MKEKEEEKELVTEHSQASLWSIDLLLIHMRKTSMRRMYNDMQYHAMLHV